MQHLRDFEAIRQATMLCFPGKESWELTAEERVKYYDIYDKILEKSVKLYNEKQGQIWHVQHALHTQLFAEDEDDTFSLDEAWRCFGRAE